MADMTTIKERIAETIYPNGTGAITAEKHQALLLDVVDNINEVKQDTLVSGQNIRPLISGESLLGDNALAVLGTRFVYELENKKLFAMIDGALQDLDPLMANRAVHSQVAQVIVIQKEGHFQELVPLTIKNKAGLAALCWEYDGMIYEAYMEDDVLAVVSKPKGDVFDSKGRYPDLSVGFADDLVGRGESVPAEFSFRASGGKSIKDGAARIKRLRGNSVVWNQKLQWRGNDNVYKGITVTYEGGKVHIQGAPEATGINFYSLFWDEAGNSQRFTKNHYYLIRGASEHFELAVYSNVSVTGSNCITQKIGDTMRLNLRGYDLTIGQEINESFSAQVIDLTQLFQAGNEPTTIEEFNARKPIVEDEYAYNEGEVIHMTAEGIKSVGDNAWDEEWESGRFAPSTGLPNTDEGIRTKNSIKVLPNENYWCSAQNDIFAHFYDAEGSLIKNVYSGQYNYLSIKGKQFTTPANAATMTFYVVGTTTYNNDIMITLVHSGWKQDTDAGYQPYWEDRLIFDQRIKDEFPNGMKSAGIAHDVAYNDMNKGVGVTETRIGVVDMGDLEWALTPQMYFRALLPSDSIAPTNTDYNGFICAKYERVDFNLIYGQRVASPCFGIPANNPVCCVFDSSYTDAASFKAAMAGVPLYYELAEPTIIEYDEPFNLDYRVADFGTEQAIAEQPSAPISADIIYQFNAVDMIREHEIEIAELQSIITEQQSVIATMQAQLASLTNKE